MHMICHPAGLPPDCCCRFAAPAEHHELVGYLKLLISLFRSLLPIIHAHPHTQSSMCSHGDVCRRGGGGGGGVRTKGTPHRRMLGCLQEKGRWVKAMAKSDLKGSGSGTRNLPFYCVCVRSRKDCIQPRHMSSSVEAPT